MLGLGLFSGERKVLGKGEPLGWEPSLGAKVVIGPIFGFPIPAMTEGEQSHGGVMSAPELSACASREEAWPHLSLPLKPPCVPRAAGEALRFPIVVFLISVAVLIGT